MTRDGVGGAPGVEDVDEGGGAELCLFNAELEAWDWFGLSVEQVISSYSDLGQVWGGLTSGDGNG